MLTRWIETPRHGVFTSALIDALHHARTDEKGFIRVTDLAAHIQDLVPKLVAGGEARVVIEDADNQRQSAHFGTTGGDFTLVMPLP